MINQKHTSVIYGTQLSFINHTSRRDFQCALTLQILGLEDINIASNAAWKVKEQQETKLSGAR